MKIQKMTKELLPNVPGEIYEMLVEPLNHEEETIFDSKPEGRWFYHFGKLTISEFNNLKWELTKNSCRVKFLHPDSVSDIQSISWKCVSGENASPGYPVDSSERITWHKEFMLKTGRVVAPVIGIRTMRGIRILDGSHRIAALILQDKIEHIDIWLGE